MHKVMSIAEIIKHRVKGLFQMNKIGYKINKVTYEPIYEGLETITFEEEYAYL